VLLATIVLLVELVKRIYNAAAPLGLQVQVDHGSANVAMTQQLFNGVQVGTGIEQMSGPDSYREMTKGVSAKTFVLKTCLLHGLLYIKLNASGVHTLTLLGTFKQISDRTVLAEVFPKGR
jgi:hypothetical protein